MTSAACGDDQPPALTIPAIVGWAADKFVHRIGLIDGDRSWSFAEMARCIDEVAKSFIGLGLEHGDRVAIWAPNCAEWIFAGVGAQAAGGVVVPLNTRFKGPEAAFILNKSRARFLFCVNGFLEINYVNVLRNSGEDTPHLECIVVIDGELNDGCISWPTFIDVGTSVSATTARLREESVQPHHLSDIIFTSGTTGQPKGVMSRHDQTVRVFWEWSGVVGLDETDRYLIINPFFHTFGYKAGFLACLLRGATIVPEPLMDIPKVLRRISELRITTLPGPPTLYFSILDHPQRTAFDLSSLRLAVTGAAVVPMELIRRLRDEMTFSVILTAYGLTESTGTITMCHIDDDPSTISTTSGRPIADVEVRIVDNANLAVPHNTLGEILCRGYNVMPGYFEDPQATAATIDSAGWLHTGDIGTMNEKGYVTITDRLKDMYIVGGFNAYPAEIENALLLHEAIAQVAVIGRPDERMGEVGHAFVVLGQGKTLAEADLITWSHERMANYKVPRFVTFVQTLPTNAAGKVMKFELRQKLND